jgi:predicted enzyme related to lactoylglutathione lyase
VSGQVIHFEIPADDPERAYAFYQDVFGWRINAMPEMQYALVQTTDTDESGAVTTPGAINGGMLRRQGAITGPVITVGTDDLEATLAQVEKAGGAVVVPKTAVGDMGFSAYITDPEGNVVGLWQNAEA